MNAEQEHLNGNKDSNKKHLIQSFTHSPLARDPADTPVIFFYNSILNWRLTHMLVLDFRSDSKPQHCHYQRVQWMWQNDASPAIYSQRTCTTASKEQHHRDATPLPRCNEQRREGMHGTELWAVHSLRIQGRVPFSSFLNCSQVVRSLLASSSLDPPSDVAHKIKLIFLSCVIVLLDSSRKSNKQQHLSHVLYNQCLARDFSQQGSHERFHACHSRRCPGAWSRNWLLSPPRQNAATLQLKSR